MVNTLSLSIGSGCRLSLVVAVALCAGGCASHDPFDDALAGLASYRPSVESIPARTSVVSVSTKDEAAPLDDEETIVGRPGSGSSLAELVDQALAKNPTTRAEWERVRAAAAVVERVQAAYLPRFSLEGSAGQSQVLYPTPFGTQTSRGFTGQGAAVLTWRLIDFGRRDANTARAAQMLRATTQDYQRRVQKIVYEVQAAYFKLAAARVTEEAARMTVEYQRTRLADIEEQAALGLLTRPEALEARRQFTRANYEYETARAVSYDARAALSITAGMPASASVHIATIDEIALPEGLELSVDSLVASALDSRPDIGAAIARVAAARESVKHAEADFMPTIDFEGAYGFMDMDLNSFVPGQSGPSDSFQTQWGVGLTGSWLLFDGGERTAALREARAAKSAAEHDLEATRLQVTGEVWDAYFDILSNRRRLEAAEALVASAKDSYEAIHMAFVTGLTTTTELLAQEAMLADARSSLGLAKSGLLEAAARLAYAAGQ